ncbi:UNVERIFIED_CONTAM: hypothetical protein RMT77_015820 [Armadillidium vulgare]
MISSYHLYRILNFGGFVVIIFSLIMVTIVTNWIHVEYQVQQLANSQKKIALQTSQNYIVNKRKESYLEEITKNDTFNETKLQKNEAFLDEKSWSETFSEETPWNETFYEIEMKGNEAFYKIETKRNETFYKIEAQRNEAFSDETPWNETFYEIEAQRNEAFSDETPWNETFYEIEAQRNETFFLDINSFVKCDKQHQLYKTVKLDEKYDPKVLRRHPNLPLFLTYAKIISILIPPIYRIRWSGTVYQESWKEHPKCLLYSANFDSRLPDGLIIRIISLCEDRRVALNSFCQFWYNEKESPITSPIYESGFPGLFVGNNYELKTSMLTCKVPLQKGITKFPIAVSIVKSPCTISTNILKIGGSPRPRDDTKMNSKNLKIGLCGKVLFFYNYDFSTRLIEWIEILKLVGVSKFLLYKSPCHENVEKVLDYYEKKGIVKVLDFHFPSPFIQVATFFRLWTNTNYGQFNGIQRVFYNDCVQRNKDDFDFIAIFDYDEIPVLRKHQNLQDFLNFIQLKDKRTKDAAAVGLKWKLHYAQLSPTGPAVNVSEDLYIIRHNVRSPLNTTFHSSGAMKSIYNTRKVLYVHCHGPIPFKTTPPLNALILSVDRELAYTAHFRRRNCNRKCVENGFEEENRLLEYKDEVKKQMDIVQKEIELLAK